MIRDIHISAVMNGWLVKIGCQTLVFESTGDLLNELSQYLREPEATEAKYRQYAMNAKHTLSGPAVCETISPEDGVAMRNAVDQLVRDHDAHWTGGRSAGRVYTAWEGTDRKELDKQRHESAGRIYTAWGGPYPTTPPEFPVQGTETGRMTTQGNITE